MVRSGSSIPAGRLQRHKRRAVMPLLGGMVPAHSMEGPGEPRWRCPRGRCHFLGDGLHRRLPHRQWGGTCQANAAGGS